MSRESTAAQTAGIEYDELAIEVSVGPGGQREVRVLDPPQGGGARELFQAPYTVEELNRRLAELDELLMRPDAESARQRRKLAESIGEDLYGALFPDGIGEVLRGELRRLSEKQSHGRAGLRLRLSFGETMKSIPEILGLPWELVCSPDRSFSVSSPETPLVRHFDLAHPGHPIRIEPPIRVLAVLASPTGLRPIDLKPHKDALKMACKREGMELEVLWRPPLTDLREQLQERRDQGRPVHVLHFLGHGGFDDDGIGGLNFERSDGSRDRVSGEALAKLLAGCQVQMAVLTTCLGARMMIAEGQHPFTGVASALVAGRVPAVVAMQFPVSEEAAIEFTRSFYSHLAAGRPLEEAVTEGRLAILANDSNNVEWASPVLFLRAPDGKVVTRKEKLEPPYPRGDEPRGRGSGHATATNGDVIHAPNGTVTTNRRDTYSAGGDINMGRGRGR